MGEYNVVTLGVLTKTRERVKVEELESTAIKNADLRESIISALNVYAYQNRGTAQARAAKRAIKRISVITMLEMLHDEPE